MLRALNLRDLLSAQLARNSTCSNFRVLLGQQVTIIDICTERSTKGPAAFQLKHPARPGFDPLFLVAPAVFPMATLVEAMSELKLTPETSESLMVEFKVAGLNTFQLELEKEMKVRDVKKVAQEECNIEPEHMRLIYNSRQLKDWDTLESYKGDSPIQVFFTAGHAALLGGVGGTGGGPRGGHGAKPQKNPFATPVRGVPGSKGARSSRVSGRPGGMALIRKYGIMMKRQEFREKAEEIGFVKSFPNRCSASHRQGEPNEESGESSSPSPLSPSLEAELADWRRKVLAQRESIAQSERERGELRAEVERLQHSVASLTSERDRLSRGGAAKDAEDRSRELEVKLQTLKEEKAEIESGLAQQETELAAARLAAAKATEDADAVAKELLEEEARLDKQRQSLSAAEARRESEDSERANLDNFGMKAATAAAEKRLESMVSVEEVQRCEKEARSYREALVSVDKEARQLRLALADALSSGTDLSMAKRELEVLRDAQEAASHRVKALESVNEQLEKRIAQVEAEIATLKKGTVDLRSEEDLMREVIVSQSEQLLRRVEDLTAEEKLAAEDRRQLLATAAQLAAEAALAEINLRTSAGNWMLRNKPSVQKLNAYVAPMMLCVNRPQESQEMPRPRHHDMHSCQVLGPEGEGPFAGALEQVSVLDGEEDQAIRDEIGRLDAKATAKMVEANQGNQVNQANPSGQKPRANLSRSFDWEKGMASLQHYHQEGEQVYLAMQWIAMQRDIAARWPTTSTTPSGLGDGFQSSS
eukprot:symbB.v1.2.024907.t1/scaffold2390.1/size80330/6